jgi:hypothetical protein
MKTLLFILSLLFANISAAHEYYFAFAEVEYDEINSRIEATLTVSTHDFEFYLQQKGIIQGDLNKSKSDSLKMQLIEAEILKHFKIDPIGSSEVKATNEVLSAMKLEGFETNLTGTVEFYLSLEIHQPLKTIEFTFDVLMDQHSNQQNKLYFITRDKKRTIDFLPFKQIQLIDIN